MANTPSAKKRIRTTLRKTDINKSRKSRIKTFIRKVEDAIDMGKKMLSLVKSIG